jgi:hypothetical protein
MSNLLAGVRRNYWREQGEPERPPLPALGEYDREVSTGEPFDHIGDLDGDYGTWRRRQDRQHALAAEAQRAWEEKARAEAAEWAERVQGAPDTGARP